MLFRSLIGVNLNFGFMRASPMLSSIVLLAIIYGMFFAIEKNRKLGLPTDYLSLSMPTETRYYVPKLQALKNIFDNPTAFNLQLDPIPNQPYFVTITKSRDIDLRIATGGAAAPFSADWTCDIRLGDGAWEGRVADLLFAADLLPVCAPALASRLRRVSALARLPLLDRKSHV